MPWTTDSPPPPAKNWSAEEKQKCVSAANAALADGKSDKEAIFACIRAAGRSERMNEGHFFIPTEDAAEGVLIFPVGKFYRDGVEREFTPADANQMVANFRNNIIGRLPPVNREHKRELGKIGNITRLYAAPDGVRGDIDGDLSGFDYISPEVRWTWPHPKTGEEHKAVLMGAGATNYPFFGGDMSLNNDAALLWTGSEWEEYENMPDENTLWDKIKDQVNELVNQRLGDQATDDNEQEEAGGTEMAQETPEVEVQAASQETELATEPTAEDYAERIGTLEAQLESFAAALKEEKTARDQIQEAFNESEKQRRLMHFSDVVRTFAVGTDEPEKFAEDLYAIEQADPELAERVVTRWRAASEAVQKAGLFEQFSQADKGESAGDPFLNAVEAKRLELYADEPQAEGWVKAEKLVAQAEPQMARDYAIRSRGGE
jgi:hypothetical protein